MIVPKIVWPSAGANELLFAFPPVGVRPFDRAVRRHDTIASSGKRQSLLERTDKFLELDITLVPTEAEQYLTRVEEFDHADWVKSVTALVTTINKAAPDGTNTADEITFSPGGVTPLINQIPSEPTNLSGRTLVFSIWIRRVSGTGTIKIRQGDGTNKIVILSSSWQRFPTATISPDDAECIVFRDGLIGTDVIDLWGAMLAYDVLGPYVKTQGVIPAAIDRWDTFITAVLDGTNFDYYPDAFGAGFTTYVLEDKAWRPKLQIRGANRFYEFKLRLREFV